MSHEITVSEPRFILRSAETEELAHLQGVGVHRPVWADADCPSCGSAPCGPHPDILICDECGDEWPCNVVAHVAVELERLVDETDWAWAVGSSLRARAAELRGEVSP